MDAVLKSVIASELNEIKRLALSIGSTDDSEIATAIIDCADFIAKEINKKGE